MTHLVGPNNSPWHCALDWLGKTAAALLVIAVVLYGSTRALGRPEAAVTDRAPPMCSGTGQQQ